MHNIYVIQLPAQGHEVSHPSPLLGWLTQGGLTLLVGDWLDLVSCVSVVCVYVCVCVSRLLFQPFFVRYPFFNVVPNFHHPPSSQ